MPAMCGHFFGVWKVEYLRNKIVDLSLISESVTFKEIQNSRIVSTNGCFDIFHYGHLASLSHSSTFGDHLVVGLNDDESVNALKGKHRPIFKSEHRAAIIASLPFVSLVVVFCELTPVNFLRAIRPSVHCKGADYAGREREMAEYEALNEMGSVLKFVPLVHGLSTSIAEKHLW